MTKHQEKARGKRKKFQVLRFRLSFGRMRSLTKSTKQVFARSIVHNRENRREFVVSIFDVNNIMGNEVEKRSDECVTTSQQLSRQ